MSQVPRPPTVQLPLGAGVAYKLFAAVVVLLLGNQAISIYVETLWYDSVGYESVYWYRLAMQWGTFAIFALATGGSLWILLAFLSPGKGESRKVLEFGGETLVIPPPEFFRRVAASIALVFGMLFGLAYSINWPVYALFLNRPEPSVVVDPILGQDLNFYLFVLPALESLSSWFISISVITLLAAMLVSALDESKKFRGLSAGLALTFLALATRAYLYRFHLLYQEHPLISGVTYVDENAIIPGLWFITGALLVGAAVSAYNVQACQVRNIAIAAGLPVLVYVFAWVLVPGYVTNFVVRPNELVRESPYINHNIEHTRRAFGLDEVENIPFEPAVTGMFDPESHTQTLDNVRLWDGRALQSTLQQVQEIRTYYDFSDVDVDRYVIDGEKRSMMLATRELNLTNLPAGSSNWINERLIFTHGYGVTMNPVSRFTNEGLPELILRDMPVESTVPSINLERPEIYFGELTNWPVYVKTGQPEFNYPEGDSNNYSTYEADAGIRVGSMLRRLLLAYETGELMTLPFAQDVTPDSELLMRRNLRDRISRIAPFLIYDDDAYIVVGDDGGLYWMVDAFTVSSTYPYSRQILFRGQGVNYIRNSVKVVINAYDGTTRFYVFEPEDPVIQAYSKTFPDLFLSADEMPAHLAAHVRYPELMFRIQALVYATYHVEDPQVFYNREDLWTVAQQGRSQAGSDEIEPYFVLLRFPGEEDVEFVSILPFTPSNRNNLIGWMAARSDGEQYGKLRAYQFPKTRFVDGPLQIEARIDQDPELSSQLSLWNQQGSTVLRGNLLVIPLDDTLLFVAPIFLQAERSPMPELRIVVLATQDRMAYGASFEEALTNLLDRSFTFSPDSEIEITEAGFDEFPTGDAAGATEAVAALPTDLIQRANQALADYQRFTSQGRMADAGQSLEDLREALDELNLSSP
jgi:uncharacterized membrane protein (UPF0182 family)